MKRLATQLTFEMFKLAEVQVATSRPESVEGFPFEFELGRRMVQELGSSTKRFGNLMTQISTLNFMEKVAAKVMKPSKLIKLF